jgi:hypothetical protein
MLVVMRGLAFVVAAALVACGDDHTAATDGGTGAADAVDAVDAPTGAAPCWPDTLVVPRGQITLGTGYGEFEPMPDVLPLEYGSQDGFNLVAHARMTGFAPGDPHNILDPSNPRTRFRAFFADTNVPLDYHAGCPYRYGYVPSAGGGYEFARGLAVIFETCWRPQHLFGKRIRIEVEIEDSSGGYARDSKIVTVAPPPSGYPIEPDSPGCQHPLPRVGLADF